MKELQKDIEKKQLQPLYLLYGDENYLVRLYEKKLRLACVDGADTININKYEGKGINPREIIDLAETLPFFAEHRLILLENTGFLKNSCEELADYAAAVPNTTCLVFIEQEVDKRTKLYKAIKANGRVVELKVQDENTLTKWILGILKKEHKTIMEAALRLFMEKTGNSMDAIQQELEKLLCYTFGRDSITVNDVERICTTQTTNKIFDMINAIAEKKQKKALDLYYDLLALKEPPMRILFLINRQFHLLMQVKDLLRLHVGKSEIGAKTGLHGFVVGKYMSQAKAFQIGQLREAVEDCVQAEEDVKLGKLNDKMCVELIIMKYSN